MAGMKKQAKKFAEKIGGAVSDEFHAANEARDAARIGAMLQVLGVNLGMVIGLATRGNAKAIDELSEAAIAMLREAAREAFLQYQYLEAGLEDKPVIN